MRDLPFIASMLFTHVQSGADRTGYRRFTELGQIFNNKLIFLLKNFKLSELKSGKWFGQSVNILSK